MSEPPNIVHYSSMDYNYSWTLCIKCWVSCSDLIYFSYFMNITKKRCLGAKGGPKIGWLFFLKDFTIYTYVSSKHLHKSVWMKKITCVSVNHLHLDKIYTSYIRLLTLTCTTLVITQLENINPTRRGLPQEAYLNSSRRFYFVFKPKMSVVQEATCMDIWSTWLYSK
jgi:hypothetical protein